LTLVPKGGNIYFRRRIGRVVIGSAENAIYEDLMRKIVLVVTLVIFVSVVACKYSAFGNTEIIGRWDAISPAASDSSWAVFCGYRDSRQDSRQFGGGEYKGQFGGGEYKGQFSVGEYKGSLAARRDKETGLPREVFGSLWIWTPNFDGRTVHIFYFENRRGPLTRQYIAKFSRRSDRFTLEGITYQKTSELTGC